MKNWVQSMITKVKPPRVVPLLLVCLFSWSGARAADFFEPFDREPAPGAWRVFGDTGLFEWDESASSLNVTWDSRRPNSYLQLPLGTELRRSDTFVCEFDLTLHDLQLGVTDGQPFAFQLAAGFQQSASAQHPDFVRGTATGATNLVEFNYFPDSGFGATVWPVAVDDEGTFNFNGGSDFVIQELPLNQPLRIRMGFDGEQEALHLTVTSGDSVIVPVTTVPLTSAFSDFSVDAFAISSYSDTGADGSLLAHGSIDNVRLTYTRPVEDLRVVNVGSETSVEFSALAGWRHQLQRAIELPAWANVGEPVEPAENIDAVLLDPAPPVNRAFYRIESTRR